MKWRAEIFPPRQRASQSHRMIRSAPPAPAPLPEGAGQAAAGLRVLWITSAYPANAEDPRGTFIRTMARSLAAAGVRITVLAPAGPQTVAEEDWEGVHVVRARYWFKRHQRLAVGVGGVVPNLRSQPLLAFQLPTFVLSLCWKALWLARGADLVHAHWVYPSGLAACLAGYFNRRPFVVTSHGGDLNLADRVPPFRILSRAVAKGADACVAVSQALIQKFAALGVPRSRLHLIPCGVDAPEDLLPPDRLSRTAVYTRLRSSTEFRVLYVGSLIPRKSVATLLEAHRLLQARGHSLLTVIVGTGPAESELQQAAKLVGLRGVFFAGQQEPSSIPFWMRMSDVLVLPSRSEGRPVVVLQAMANQLPVVASDIPGTRDLVEDESTGFLFRAGSAPALAEVLARLERAPDVRARTAAAALDRIVAEDLLSDGIARRHMALYQALITGRGTEAGSAQSEVEP